MYTGLYYISARNNSLKRITGVTSADLIVLELLRRHNIPLPYMRLYTLLHEQGFTHAYKAFTEILNRCIANKYISRSEAGMNVLYCITLEGKRFLHTFSMELERIVEQDIRKYGNGFTE